MYGEAGCFPEVCVVLHGSTVVNGRGVTMKVWISICVTLAILSGGSAQLGAAEANRPEVLAELWFLSVRRVVVQPDVTVLMSGQVRVRLDDGQQLEGQISAQQLAELRLELLDTCGLGTLDSQQLASEIQWTAQQHGLSAVIPNADQTVIRVRDAAGQLREVRCHAVGLLVNRFPSVAGLQGMYRAETRLQNLRSVLQVGGAEAAAGIAQYASASLQAQNPEATPLGVHELAMVRRFPDGTRYIQFCRQPDGADRVSGSPLIVAVTEVPGGEPQVSVFGGSSLR